MRDIIMNCDICGTIMEEVKITKDAPYRYTLSGLKNVFLAGISVYECKVCDVKYPVIPKIGELHNAIAKAFINKKQLLTGAEIRFLRKNAGFSGVKFSSLIRIGAAHLSNVEHDRDKLSPTADKMVRIIAEAVSAGERCREMLLEEASRLQVEKKGKSSDKNIFRLSGESWQQLDLVA